MAKRKFPNVWSLKDLVDHARSSDVKVNVGDKWLPARPLGFPSFARRLSAALLVFRGKADAVVWPAGQ